MKITALGVNSAFALGEIFDAVPYGKIEEIIKQEAQQNKNISVKRLLQKIKQSSRTLYDGHWQSNFLIEFEGNDENPPFKLIVDFGSDIRHSLLEAKVSLGQIDGYYCSHPHADHIGGVEYIGLSSIFNPFFRPGKAEWLKKETGEFDSLPHRLANGIEIPAEFRPRLYGHKSVIGELWNAARPGLETIQGVPDVNINTYFDVVEMHDNHPTIFYDGKRTWKVYTVTSVHVNAGYRQMPSFGLWIEGSDGQIVFMPTDTQFMTPKQVSLYYDRADVVYQDCETGPRSDVHPHIDDLKTLSESVKKKLILYHYNQPPEIGAGEFREILIKGTIHQY